ncbi:hypothetical protein GKZ28_20515 [Clostridium chromiireducens]|uniref:Uncharacterized protein n=1 Tax=Clostridium chromiireducens TaxID=225345 RepID=A0A964W407_9CLOT|nr:hypothetical protein [Clostridium chromiireducens]MVX66066.1 hypothetical protein [Clostridium chromiireducens]
MSKVKKIIKSITILIILVILFGCGDVGLKSSTVIDGNESGSVKLQIVYDEFIASKLNRDIFDLDWAEESGYEFNRYVMGDMNIEEIVYKFNNINELEEKINSSGLATMTHSKDSQMREKIYTIELKFNRTAIDNLIMNNINNDENLYNYICNIRLNNEVKVPGIIIKSNPSVNINENTNEWIYKLSQIDNNTYISLSYK